MIIYFDGSIHKLEKEKSSFGYAAVLHCGKEFPIEKYESMILSNHQIKNFEFVAFLKAFELVKENNLNYKKVSFVTDGDLLYYQSVLNEENYQPERKNELSKNFKRYIKFFQMEKYENEIFDCILNSRISKVKAHTNIIDNIRVDYLARLAHKNEVPIKYDKFLECAFMRYEHDGIKIFNLPFFPDNQTHKIRI